MFHSFVSAVLCVSFFDNIVGAPIFLPCKEIASEKLFPVQSLQATAADSLSKFYYPPVAAVTISYPEGVIRDECLIDGKLKGFGQLHPRSQGVETLGTHTKFIH